MKAEFIYKSLSKFYCQPEWTLIRELQAEPGYSKKQRRMDAVAINNWPTGKYGHAIIGFEVKVSRADFKNDEKDPEKFSDTYCMCDAAFYVAPKSLLDGLLIPESSAGLIEVSEYGSLSFSERYWKKSERPVPRAFLAAIARKCDPKFYEMKVQNIRAEYFRKFTYFTRNYDREKFDFAFRNMPTIAAQADRVNNDCKR